MDVKTAFLNGLLEEEIYMRQPGGFGEKGNENKVWKLNRSIYGLKQASRQWYILFDNAITSYGFSMTEGDHCIYTNLIFISFFSKTFRLYHIYFLLQKTIKKSSFNIHLVEFKIIISRQSTNNTN